MTLTLLTKLDWHDKRMPPPLATEELRRVASQLGLDVNVLQENMNGGFGSVFIAEDHGLSRRVAIKILYKAWKPERMRREILALRTFCSNQFLHSHLIAIYSCFETEHYFCYTMECADNCMSDGAEYKPDSLSNRIAQCDKPPSADEIAVFFHQLLDAVEFLHSQKLVHLDIKPDNILFVKGKLKLADYSLITRMEDVIDKSCGTTGFVPPNQRHHANGGLDGVDQDLYALGVVLRCYAENSRTWDGVSPFPKELQSQQFYKRLNRFLLKACNACESERFRNVVELRKGFDACFPQKKHWSRMLMAGIPVVLLIAVLALQVMFVINRRQKEKENELNKSTVAQQEAVAVSGKAELKSEDVKSVVNSEDKSAIAPETIATSGNMDLKLENGAVTLEERLALAKKELAELSMSVDAPPELLEDKRFGQDVEWMIEAFDELKVSLRKVQIRELEKQMEIRRRAKNLDVSQFSETATADFQRRFKEYTAEKTDWGYNGNDFKFSRELINELQKGQVNPNVEVVDSRYQRYSGPILSCIFSGRIKMAEEMARELLKLGADAEVCFSQKEYLALSQAGHVVLSEGGVDKMAGFILPVLGTQALYRSAMGKHDLKLEDLVARLICLKHNLVERYKQNNTALHYAAKIGSARLVALMLLEGADVNAVNDAGETPLHLALKYGHFQIEPLLLMAQADTTLKNVKGEIPEDLRKVGLFFQSIEKKDYPVIRSALENGMSPDMFCSNDATILLMACCNCDVELVKLLLEFNANVELAGAEDYPLNSMPVSCAFREKSLDIVEMLLEKGANPNVCPPGYGGVYYLVDYLCDKSDSFYGNDKEKGRRWFKAFLNAPKPPTLVNGSGPTINNAFKAGVEDEFVFLLLDKYDSFPEESDVIATALFYEKSDSIVKGLVDKKADVNAVFTIPKYTKIQKLREVIKTRGGQKTTALWLAVEQNRPKIVELLIKNGADVNWKNEQGKTVKELPATEEIREIFQTYGVKVSENASVEKMAAVAMPTENLYVVVDLSGGTEADNYPLRYTNTAPDLNDNTCRTTELWLRRIPKGAFVMGSPIDEVGRYISEPQHDVTLTQDYYIGVFECTQKQWELVMGSNPSIYTGDCRPVETVSYDMIRGPSATAGAGWPMYGHTVDASSFMGLLQAKTGLVFDLSTEAQWEYACRAGTTSAFNSGKNHTSSAQDAVMDEVGRYAMNKSDGKGGFSQHTTVGSYQPNAWGLYDMHGNVYELCLDWYARSYYSISSLKDPTGPIVEMRRTERGGCWRGHVDCCRSACRSSNIPSLGNDALGFRIVFLP